MNADGEVFWTSLGDDIDSTDISIKEGFMVHSGLFHADDHAFIAKIAESGVIYLNVSWIMFIMTDSFKTVEYRHKTYDNPICKVLLFQHDMPSPSHQNTHLQSN
jgi:hypothetical protein